MNEKVMVADTLADPLWGDDPSDRESSAETNLKTDEKSVRDVPGGDLPDCPCKRLLCAGSSGNKGRSGSCQKRA